MTQLPGTRFKATNVEYKKGQNFSELSLDISKAYPETAGISSWKRNVHLNKGKNVEVTDIILLTKTDNITEHLMTCYPSEAVKPGEVVIHYRSNDGTAKDFVIKYNAKQMQAAVEKIPLTSMEDKGILNKWGDNIYRINFTVIAPKMNDKINFVIGLK